MATGGYLQWTSRHLKDYFYLDGKTYTVHQGFDEISVAESDECGLIVIPTAAGTHVLQKPYYYGGSNRSSARTFYEFQFKVMGYDEEEFFRLKRASARGASFYFVPFLWVEEYFPGAEVAVSYTLTRPVAWGIATGVTSGTHPAVYFKADVEDANCASISGQTLTIAEQGDITVRYMPAYRVICAGLSESYTEVNKVVMDVTLREVVALA